MDAASAVLVIVWAIATWSTIRPLLAHRGETRYWLIGAVGGVGTFALAMAIIQPLVWAIRELGLSQHLAPGYFEIFVSAGYAPWVAVLAVGVYAPLVEELAFRGVILTGLAPSLGARDALWLSSLLFMAWHMQPAMFPHTLALGLLTGTLRLRSGSLYPCILAHGVHNALAMLADWAGW
jgi:hypothetical protein